MVAPNLNQKVENATLKNYSVVAGTPQTCGFYGYGNVHFVGMTPEIL